MSHKWIQPLTLMVGVAVGYAAASGYFNTPRAIDASTSPPTVVTTVPPSLPAAVVAHNEKVNTQAAATGKKPNILVLWGDDVGISNLSCYSNGLMGYVTPNIDRLAKEGLMLQHYYGEQSCTAGRAAFLTG